MKTVTLKFVVKDEQTDNIAKEVEGILEFGLQYTMYGWSIEPSTKQEIEFKENEDRKLDE